MKFLRLLPLLGLVVPALAFADPASELASFSTLGKVDPAELARSGVKTAAGAPMNTPRYLSVQSCFVVQKPPAEVKRALRQFDPTAHRELKVYLHGDLPASPVAANFSKLNSPPNNSAVKALSAAMQKMDSTLQLSRAEAQQFGSGQPAFAFWTYLLTKRAQAFAAGGAAAQPAYEQNGPAVQPAKEMASLVRQAGAVDRQFGGLLRASGLIGGKGSLKPEQYWELLQVEDDGVLTLGSSSSRETSAGGFQIADGLYYASGGFYVALTLYQLWPVEIGGRGSTLLWRGDFISAASLGDLHGVERIASEGAMKKDISKAINLFKSEASR